MSRLCGALWRSGWSGRCRSGGMPPPVSFTTQPCWAPAGACGKRQAAHADRRQLAVNADAAVAGEREPGWGCSPDSTNVGNLGFFICRQHYEGCIVVVALSVLLMHLCTSRMASSCALSCLFLCC